MSLAAAVELLASSSRRERQNAVAVAGEYARANPEDCVPYIPDFIDALECREARTRWECLDILSRMVEFDSRACERAVEGAEEALFDETNAFLRVSALRFLCKFGATTELRSKKVWPLINEAIQCYHGDAEFQDMLLILTEFSEAKLDPEVTEAFIARVSFDAEHGKGALGRRMQQIRSNLQH
jgi:hypothetical protein